MFLVRGDSDSTPLSVYLLKTRGVLLLLEPVFLNLVPYQALALILVEKLIV